MGWRDVEDTNPDSDEARRHRRNRLRREVFKKPEHPEPDACTKCRTATAFTDDWTLWPWPDGAWLCGPCNDERHDLEDWTEVERAVAEARPSFTCPNCGRVSYNPNDIANRYCGACHQFVDDPRR